MVDVGADGQSIVKDQLGGVLGKAHAARQVLKKTSIIAKEPNSSGDKRRARMIWTISSTVARPPLSSSFQKSDEIVEFFRLIWNCASQYAIADFRSKLVAGNQTLTSNINSKSNI